jgi:hypothetical protein
MYGGRHRYSQLFGRGAPEEVTLTGVGTCVVTANQAGNANFTAAAAVSHSIVVNAALLTVTANNVSRAYGSANMLNHNPMLGTLHPPRRVTKADRYPPQWHKIPATLRVPNGRRLRIEIGNSHTTD